MGVFHFCGLEESENFPPLRDRLNRDRLSKIVPEMVISAKKNKIRKASTFEIPR
jgi:hypothetical protein